MLTKQQVCDITGYQGEFDPNPVQEASFRPVFGSNLHLLVAAGTGCGKTLMYEWAMHKALRAQQHVIVIAPNKALVEQKSAAWRNPTHCFSRYRLVVKTGDYVGISSRDLSDNPIKIMTPEAFAVSLRSRNAQSWVSKVGLLVVDEIHTLGTDSRGNGLEACILNFFLKCGPKARFVGVSASVDNKSLQDMMTWISALSEKKIHAIKSNWRPIPLIYKFIPYKDSKNYNIGEANKKSAVVNLVSSLDQKVLIFVHTKKFGYALTKSLQDAGFSSTFHCADFKRSEKLDMEKKFVDGDITTLVSTSTLAVGCDFPVEDVIVAGVHRGMNVVELDTLQQMAGRAGHQGTCEKGVVHFIVPNDDPKHWEKYIREQYSIKSELTNKRWLAFHTIAVIADSEVADEKMLEQWYEKTLAFVQEGHSRTRMEDMIEYLRQAKAIKTTESDNEEEEFYATLLGHASARFYFDPMDVFKWCRGLRTLTVRNHAQACAILASGETLVQDFNIKPKDIPPAVTYRMQQAGYGEAPITAQFFYYLAVFLSGVGFEQRESLPTALKVPLYNFYKELQRVITCLNYLANKEPDMELSVRCLEDTILKISHGVPDEVLDLVRIKNVGRARAMKLAGANILSADDIYHNKELVLTLLGPKVGQKVYLEAEKVADPPPF